MPQDVLELIAQLEASVPHFWLIATSMGAFLAGLLISWLFATRPLKSRRRAQAEEIERLRGTVNTLGRNLSSAEVQAARVPKLEARSVELTERLMGVRAELSETSGMLTAERQAHQARVEELRRIDEEMQNRFQSIASGALDRNARAFLGFVS
ncbi:MAG: hypothetical protein AAFR46_19785, partial [Pseudomonadota bacterium]